MLVVSMMHHTTKIVDLSKNIGNVCNDCKVESL